MAIRVLLIDDDPSARRALKGAIAAAGYEVLDADSAERGLALSVDFRPHIVLSDIRLPGMTGLELLRLLKERSAGTDTILMTAYDDMPTAVQAMRDGAFDYLAKPIRVEELEAVLARAAGARARRPHRPAEPEESCPAFDSLIGRDASMRQVYKVVGQLASTRVAALIRGPTGSGKGVVAHTIHSNSAAADEPYIAVNCTALPQNLLESELFGHVRGAFTGAIADRRGRFALAGEGTIFLDEVGDTTLDFQAKLLRVLEDRLFYPVGADRPERTGARVLAATHRDLEGMISRGAFREDLYYRLRVVEVWVPPLRERSGDIPLLAAHFARRAAVEMHRAPPTISPEAMQSLLAHDWPGNVRELEHCITRAVVLAAGGVIMADHLGLRPAEPSAAQGHFPGLDEQEALHVRRALRTAGGNRTRAAALLKVSKPRLYRLLEKHRITE
jgi:DNA-binding NtrC family response regulator